MPNFLYEILQEKSIVGTLKNGKILNKFFYYDKLEKLDFDNFSYFFLQDDKFNYYYKPFFFQQKEKFSISQLNKLIGSFEISKNENIAGYILNNIEINNTPQKYILGATGKISFGLGIFTIENKYLEDIKKIFGKKNSIKIFPNSFFSIKCISKTMKNGNFIYFGKEQIKLIQIINGFYSKVETLPIGLNYIDTQLNEIFHSADLNNLNDFSKKVYIKKLKELIEPISIFIKTNSVSEDIFVVGNFKKYPKLLEELSNSIKTKLLPFKIDSKSFDTIYQLDLYCIGKYYDKIGRN